MKKNIVVLFPCDVLCSCRLIIILGLVKYFVRGGVKLFSCFFLVLINVCGLYECTVQCVPLSLSSGDQIICRVFKG